MVVKSLEKEIVRIYTDGREGEEVGEFVMCLNCNELQLIPLSQKACEKCGSKNLEYANKNSNEATPEQIEEMGYELEFVI